MYVVVLLFSEMLSFSQKWFLWEIFFLLREYKKFDGMFQNINLFEKIRVKVAKLLQAKITTNHSPLSAPPPAPPKFIASKEDKE